MYSNKNIYSIILNIFISIKIRYNLIKLEYSKGGISSDDNNKNSFNSIFGF